MDKIYATEDKSDYPAPLMKDLEQIAGWAARKLGIPTPQVKIFLQHGYPDLHAAVLRDGGRSFELKKPSNGFVVSGEAVIWIDAAHALAGRRMEKVETVLHEVRHVAKAWLAKQDKVLCEEDAYGWTYQAIKVYAAEMVEQERQARVERDRRLAAVRADIDRLTPEAVRALEAERRLAERKRQAEEARRAEQLRQEQGVRADLVQRYLLSQGVNPRLYNW